MELTNKKILITGGGSGIGLEVARMLLAKGNQVMIVGRDKEKLETAAALYPRIMTAPCDINDSDSVERLRIHVEEVWNGLDIMINNAAYADLYTLGKNRSSYETAYQEAMTNYLSVIRLTDLFMPLLRKSTGAAIVNVTSEVIYTPSMALPTYSASKVALHTYTQLLRRSLTAENIKVFELLPPLVNTAFSKRAPGEYRVLASEVAEALVAGIIENRYQIRIDINEALIHLYMQS